MKKLITLSMVMLISIGILAQAPQRMSYQAVIRNSSNALVTSSPIGMRVSILQGSASGPVVYTETQTPTTNANGLVSIEIGGGTGFDAIIWANDLYFLKTETDPAGGTNYTISGTSQLLSVPYSLYTNEAANGFTSVYTTGEKRPVLSKPDGNIGLEAAPDSWNKLNINGNVNITPGTKSTYGVNLVLDAKPQAGGVGYGIFSLSNGASEGGGKFLIKNDNVSSTFVMDNNGHTGINNLNPAHSLDVTGDVNFTGILLRNGSSFGLDFSALTNKPATLAGYGITDGMSTSHPAYTITSTNISNWNTAYGWGNHAGLYRPIGYVPVWSEITEKPTTISGYGITDAVTITGNQTITGIKTFSNDLLINGLTVGLGKGAVSYNTAIGTNALYSNTTGNQNTALGCSALFLNTTGNANSADGYYALYSNTTGNYNYASGYMALWLNTTGNSNMAIGLTALNFNTTGSYNFAIGEGVLANNVANSRSTAIGYHAMLNADNRTTGRETFNTALGYEALKGSGTPVNNTGQRNTAVGDQALFSNTTGFSNLANGYDALYSNTTGSKNTAIGDSSLYNNTTGYYNTALGYSALLSNKDGHLNTANGYFALQSNTTGSVNTADGFQALYYNTIGNNNTAIGGDALGSNTTGNYNTAFGVSALGSNTTGGQNTAIGYNANVASGVLINSTVIGSNAQVNASNNFVFGNSSVIGWGFGVAPGTSAIRVGSTTSNGNGATLTLTGVWTNASDISKKYDIENISYGINEVMKLHPVTYKLKGTDNQDIGFIAQEVKKIVPEIIYGEDGQLTMSYGQLTSVLVKAIQEQQKLIESQQKQIDELKKLIGIMAQK